MTVTLKDIAKAAGVSHPTVSRALRNHPRIGSETRRRIQALAKEMGYRPDPALTALAAYRGGKRPPHRYGKIAVLCPTEEQKLPLHIKENVTGIRGRANELGFEADVFRVLPDEREQLRLSRILYHRGIQGIIVTPLSWQPKAFDWSKFSVVGIGENAMPLRLNYVGYDHDAAIQETYLQLKARGYKNIGFLNEFQSEERNRFLFVSSYLKCRYIDGLPPAPPYLYENRRASPLPWLRKHRFDAVISHLDILREGGKFSVPKRLGVAGFATSEIKELSPDSATYMIDDSRLGATAVELLQTMIQRNQVGIPSPETQYSIVIRGHWKDGPTCLAGPATTNASR